jgi:glyoxylase-like metal-dependent hydrolase (beta-lactamase superfamily II)/rhodanese-related sulfurtransferase
MLPEDVLTLDVPTVDVDTLRGWLEQQRPVTVLDVRPSSDRAEWAIPNSLHVNAYAALWQDDPRALADVALPAGQAIVTVCAAGKTSRIAAHQLQARGLEALSLDGGMKAWSLAWNTALVPLPRTTAQVIQVRRTGKGCLSYLIGAGSSAAVIDAALPPEVYLDLAQQHGWQITHVLDTHVHADHLSRSRLLALQSGATLLLPEQNRVTFPFTAVHDGATLTLGAVRLTALRTPGHTPESTCYLLDDTALFSGDTISLAAVGRPDLLADPTSARAKAHALYHSVQRLFALDPSIVVLPVHTDAPVAFDQQPISASLGAVQARLTHLLATEASFVEQILARIPPPPPHHLRIVEFNEAGQLPEDAAELEAGANRCAVA